MRTIEKVLYCYISLPYLSGYLCIIIDTNPNMEYAPQNIKKRP